MLSSEILIEVKSPHLQWTYLILLLQTTLTDMKWEEDNEWTD